MTLTLLALYLVAAGCELGGVGLVVRQFRRARRVWLAHSEAVAEEQQLMAVDLRYRIDPLVSRYGITAGEVRRATVGIETLLAPDVKEQLLTLGLLAGGIALGTLANVLSLL